MYIMNPQGSMIVNADFVERFMLVKKPDAVLIIASYNDERPAVTMGKYRESEAEDALSRLYAALCEGKPGFTMPDSTLFYEAYMVKDARTKRKGGS